MWLLLPWALCLAPIYVIALVVKLSVIVRLAWNYNFPLSKVPGPALAAWSRIWWLKAIWSGRTKEELLKVHKDHGPIVRIAPNTILISDPSVIRKVLASGSKYIRGPWFDSLRLSPHTTNVVSERDPKKHQNIRYMLSAGLSGKGVSGVEHIIDVHIQEWMRILRSKVSQSTEKTIQVDLSQTIPYLNTDIISHLCLGESFQDLKYDADHHGLLDALQSGMLAQPYIATLLEIKDLLFRFGERHFPTACDTQGIGKVMGVIQKTVKQRISQAKTQDLPRDMLDAFLSRGLTAGQAGSELLVVLSSAVGATSYSTQGIIRGILSERSVYQALMDEIDSKTQPSPSPSPSPSKARRTIPYLQACIYEGLRMYPPIFQQLRERVVPAEGDMLHGYYIPGGTFIAINGLSTLLDSVFGSEPEKFVPERWLIKDEARLQQMHRSLELVFGYGSSKCLGVSLAMVEMEKTVFELFKNFDLDLVNEDHPWIERGDFVLSNFHVVAKLKEA